MLNQTNIYGHYNVPSGATSMSCPGKNLKNKLDAIKTKVKDKLNS